MTTAWEEAQSIPTPRASINSARQYSFNHHRWWSTECSAAAATKRKAIRAFNKLWRRCGTQRHLLHPAKERVKQASFQAKTVYKQAREQYHIKLLEDLYTGHSPPNTKQVFDVINTICGSKFSRKGIRAIAIANVHALKILAEKQCRAFSEKLSDPLIQPLQERPELLHRQAAHITEARIDAALRQASTKSSVGPDLVSTLMLRTLWDNGHRPFMTRLFKATYLNYSSQFKEAWISPISKPTGGYRPIALTSHLGKVIERIIADDLAHYLQDLPQMQSQHGCRSGHPISGVLAHLQHIATREKGEIIAIFLDIVGAYDRVDHNILLQTMQAHHVPPHIIEFTTDFLTARQFRVRIYRSGQYILSDTLAFPLMGLPQGSPLSVPLWHAYCLDVPSQITMFMDDMRGILSGADREEEAQDLLNELTDWADRRHVQFGLKKCGIISPDDVELFIQHKQLPQVKEYKYLGITLEPPTDEDNIDGMRDGFRLTKNWTLLREELERRLSWIRLLRGATLSLRRTAYISLVRSKLLYGLELTVRDFNQELQTFQNRALRLLAYAFPGVPAFKLHNLLQLPSIHDLALQRARGLYAALVDSPSEVGAAYDHWVSHHEGKGSLFSPFGLIQDGMLQPVHLLPSAPGEHPASPPPALDCIGRDFPTLDLIETAYTCRTSLIESSMEWRRNSFNPDAHTIDSRYLLFTDGSFHAISRSGGGGFYLLDLLTNNSVTNGSHIYPIFASLDGEIDGLLLGLTALLLQDPSTVIIYVDSTGLLHFLRTPLRLNRRIDERLLQILRLIATLLNRRFSLLFRWLPSHMPPTASLLFNGNNLADIAAGALSSRPTLHLCPITSSLWKRPLPRAPAPPLSTVGRYLRKLPASHAKIILRLCTNHSRLNAWTLRMALKKRAAVLLPTSPLPLAPPTCRTSRLPRPIPDKFDLDKLPAPIMGWTTAACRLCDAHPETPVHLLENHLHIDLDKFRLPTDTHLQDAVPRYFAADPAAHCNRVLRFLHQHSIAP